MIVSPKNTIPGILDGLHIFCNKVFARSNAFTAAWIYSSLSPSTAIASPGLPPIGSDGLALLDGKGAASMTSSDRPPNDDR